MERWDVEVRLGVSCRRILVAGLCPADTTVGDLKWMLFEREGCQPETFFMSPQLGRLKDHRTLAHYADRLLPPAAAVGGDSPAAPRPSVQLLLRWRPTARLFSLPSDRTENNGVLCVCVAVVRVVLCACACGTVFCVSVSHIWAIAHRSEWAEPRGQKEWCKRYRCCLVPGRRRPTGRSPLPVCTCGRPTPPPWPTLSSSSKRPMRPAPIAVRVCHHAW
jgi:hypothetical protein